MAELRDQRRVVEADWVDQLDAAVVGIAGADGIIARIEALERLAGSPLMAAQV